MHVELNPGPGRQQAARVLRESGSVFSDGVFFELPSDKARVRQIRAGRRNHRCDGVMHDPGVARFDLHRLDPAIFRQACVCVFVDPPIRTIGVHGHLFIERDGQIRLANEPVGLRTECERRRHVLRVALRRPAVHPANDRVDVRVAQRNVVFELANTHGLVEVPRRHLARHHARLDGPRPRPHILEGEERHRRCRSRVMARLARFLEDRRHVPGERHAVWRIWRRCCERGHQGRDCRH